ncbi:MAG TPA: hypothetical protein VFO89_05320, partial [Thermoanaerobaculia bacterium]|nr:hypothetical protein [Thermoanaerobaculia bacterium]
MKKSLLLLLTLALAAAPGLLAADHTGRFAAGTKYEAPPAHAPASVSRMFVKSLERGAGAVELPASGDSGMIIWAIPARTAPGSAKIATRLRTPDGAVLDTADRGSAARGVQRFVLEAAETEALGIGGGGAHEVVHIEQAAAATYELEVEMPDDVAGVLVVAAEPDSALTMSTWAAPLSRQPGQPVTLHAELRRGDAAVEGATVVARLASPNGKTFAPIALADRGNG